MRGVESADMRGGAETRARYKVSHHLYPLSQLQTIFQMRKKSDLKFSWEERQTGSHTEDWSVHKVLIISLYKILN